MANLNKELNEYLLSNKSEKQFKISLPSVTIPKPQLGKWLGQSSEEVVTNRSCYPTLVSETSVTNLTSQVSKRDTQIFNLKYLKLVYTKFAQQYVLN